MIYIAGPITGYEDYNRPAFEAAREQIVEKVESVMRSYGLSEECLFGRRYSNAVRRNIVIPHDFVPDGAEWDRAMRLCIRMLTTADFLIYLPGSQDSRGARAEMQLAHALGLPVYSLERYLKRFECA